MKKARRGAFPSWSLERSRPFRLASLPSILGGAVYQKNNGQKSRRSRWRGFWPVLRCDALGRLGCLIRCRCAGRLRLVRWCETCAEMFAVGRRDPQFRAPLDHFDFVPADRDERSRPHFANGFEISVAGVAIFRHSIAPGRVVSVPLESYGRRVKSAIGVSRRSGGVLAGAITRRRRAGRRAISAANRASCRISDRGESATR